jgi:hypothetical protein
MAEGTRVS